jgi:hypothetical protein
MRFAIRRDPWWIPLLVLMGATREQSYVSVDDQWLYVRFGFFSQRFARARVAGARSTAGHWLYGIGWHTDFVRSLILNGSLAGLVEIRLEPPKHLWLLLVPVRCSHLYISLEDPDAFLRALGQGAPLAAR